jgi:hypothetical protein
MLQGKLKLTEKEENIGIFVRLLYFSGFQWLIEAEA